MANLSDFSYTDLVDDVMAVIINRLIAGNLRGELTETKTITTTLALTDGDLPIQNLTPDGADKTVKLPVEAIGNHLFVIRNAGGAYNLVLKDSTGTTTFATISPGSMLIASPIGGLTWAVDSPLPSIDDSQVPGASPIDVAQYLSMVANQIKNTTGAANWYTVTPSVNDAQAPGSSPTSVSQLLSMLANIVKTITGAANWYSAAIMPYRTVMGANALGTTVAASTTTYLPIYGTAFNATEHGIVVPFAGVIRNLSVVTSTAQPASGALTITIRKNGVDTAVVATVPVSGAAGTYTSSTSVVVAAGDVITVKFVNAATGVSAAVKGVSLEVAVA